MNGSSDVEKHKVSLKAMKERLDKFQSGLSGVERDIDDLSTYAAALSKEIKHYKKKKVVAIASDYKSAKQELVLIRHKLHILREERENFRSVYARAEMEISKLKDQIDNILKDPGATIITADFRKRKHGR